MSPSISFNSPFMSLSFSRYVRFIFHVYPFLSLPVISLHLHSCRLVSLSFVCLSVPPLTPLAFISFPFMSLSVALCCLSFLPVPCMSLHFSLFPLLISLHLVAFSLRSLVFLPNKSCCFPRVRKKDVNNTEFFQSFSKRRPNTPNQQSAGREIRACDPPPALRIRRGGGGKGDGYPLSSLKYPTRRAMSADIFFPLVVI